MDNYWDNDDPWDPFFKSDSQDSFCKTPLPASEADLLRRKGYRPTEHYRLPLPVMNCLRSLGAEHFWQLHTVNTLDWRIAPVDETIRLITFNGFKAKPYQPVLDSLVPGVDTLYVFHQPPAPDKVRGGYAVILDNRTVTFKDHQAFCKEVLRRVEQTEPIPTEITGCGWNRSEFIVSEQPVAGWFSIRRYHPALDQVTVRIKGTGDHYRYTADSFAVPLRADKDTYHFVLPTHKARYALSQSVSELDFCIKGCRNSANSKPARLLAPKAGPKQILRLGVFFDGTGQNRYNDIYLPDRDISNITKLQDLYPDQTLERPGELITVRSTYAAGVGTITGKFTEDGFQARENQIGLGFGIGPEGGYARIERVLSEMHRHPEQADYDEIIFDVFGFSRGAALARNFVNLVNRWPEAISIQLRQTRNILWSMTPVGSAHERITGFPRHLQGRVEFVGLLDTVGSFEWPGNDQEGPFNLNLSEHSTRRVVHLVAGHEVRHNFPSTRIATATGYLAANFSEEVYPGVHCDIGGGYENPTGHGFDNWEIFPVKVHVGCNDGGLLLRAKQTEIQARGHYARLSGWDVIEEIRKPTQKEMANVPLQYLHHQARDSGAPMIEMDMTKAVHIIPDDLQQSLSAWKVAGSPMDQARHYLGAYMHTSERENSLVDRPHHQHDETRRQIFYNQPTKALKPEQ